MRIKSLCIGLAGLSVSLAHADFNPVALTPGSFNADVVVEKTAPKPLEAYANATMDGGTNNTGDTFYEQGYASFPLAPGASATGLPHPGTTFTAVSEPNHSFRMPPDYSTNNALFLGNYAGFTTGTLTLSTPAAFNTLSFLSACGNGPVNNTVTIHYANGSTQTATLAIQDWFTGSSIAWYANGRVNVDGGLDNFSPTGSTTPNLSYGDIVLTDTVDAVTSIDFQYTGGGRGGIFAVSGSTDGTTFSPVTVTGFNRDMIIEASAPKSNFTPTVSVTLDGGPTLGGAIFYETGFNGNTDGLPHPGASVVYGNHTWTMPSDYTVNNSAFLGNYAGLTTATLNLNSPAAFSGLSFLTAAGGSATSISVAVTHSGGGVEYFTINSLDWGNNSSVAYTVGGRVNPLGLGRGTTFYLHPADTTALADTVNPVTSITFTWSSGGRAVIYAVAGQTSSGGGYSPVAVSGFNADAIVEKAATPLAPLYTATTVSMDGGTNNTGATWYEQGYYPTYPNTGLPPAGSTFTSSSLADHHYQMPASYTANNAIYVDAAHTNANLTIATPQTLSALSFLSACANGWVSNACIMQYADGTSETNYFVSQDWFFNTPYAYNANGRVNLDVRQLNNVNNGNPRLYEAQFALGNTGSPVTNVVMRYLSAQNPTTGRMVVLAVSGTAGAVPPIIAPGTPASPPVMLEGTNFVLTAQVTGGTAPITKTWYYSGDNGTTWAPVSNAGFVSGATTASLTNSSVGYTNAGLYELVAQNVAGSVTSAVATVTVLSGLPDVAVPGDPIVAYQPNGGSSSAAEDVTHVIDDSSSKYYNNGTGVAPFVGPIGFVVTPSMGKTLVSVLRFYTANDATGRDPADYTLEGSNDGGNTWTTIASGPLALPTGRNAAGAALNPLTQFLQEVRFANSTGYTSYRVSSSTVRDNTGTFSYQIGEVELLGTQVPQSPIITVEPVPTDKVFVGASPTFVVSAFGYPTNLTYQWYLNGTTPISGANGPTYTFPNAQLSDSGKSFSCLISNSAGSTNSSSAVLTVVAKPTAAYPVAVLADHPVAFWRLNELPDDGAGNNGKVANDYVGGHSGIYSNMVLGATGYNPGQDADTAATFGSFASADSYAGGISDLSFATPTNTAATFSVEAWVQGPVQTTDAGIITKGTGGGGEQYNLDCGGTAHAFRFFIRNASGGAPGAVGNKGPDGNWHHVVGVCDQPHSNIVLYVDGITNAVGTTMPWDGVLTSTHFLSIGSRQSGTTTYDNQFNGTVDDVAVYPVALSPSQVLAHYYAANPPPVLSVQPTNTTVPEGSTATFYSQAYGPGSVSYQWYQSADNGGTFAPLAGQTGPNLALPNVPASSSYYQYEVVAANSFGSVTSQVATLVVVSGPPQIVADLAPETVVYAGRTVTLSVGVSGTAPFTYQWQANGVNLSDGGRLTGTHTASLTLANAQAGDAATYQVLVSNAQGGPVPSTATALSIETTPDFNYDGAGWAVNGGSAITADVLYLTDGGNSEARSSFYAYPLNIDAFYASFVYQDVNPPNPQADGFAFVVQNDPRGTAALGGSGGSLGLSGITPSWALTFNLYNGSAGGVGMSCGVNGANGGPYHSTAPVDVSAGNPIRVTILYANGNAQVQLTDLNFAVSYTTNVAVSVPAAIGGDLAYVGFTAGTGGFGSSQTISNFVFNPYPTLSATATAPNTVTVSWPASTGGFKLQSRSSLTTGSWADVVAPVNVVGSQNRVVISPATGQQFYRLVLVATP